MRTDLDHSNSNKNVLREDDFFFSGSEGGIQLEMFDKHDAALCSASIFAWEADLSKKSIQILNLSNSIDGCWPFAEFFDFVYKKDIDKINQLLVSAKRQEQEQAPVGLNIQIMNAGKYRQYSVKGTSYRLSPDKTIFAGIAYDTEKTETYLRSLEDLRKHDDLTGLNNLNTFDAFFEDLSNHSFCPQALVLANIDNLKEINDTLGYRAGNTLIKNVAAVMKESFFDAEMIARIGGGEYCAVFSGKSQLEIDMKIKEANMMLHKMYLNLIKTEVSFGYAFNETEKGFNDLYRHAINHLHRNKNLKKILTKQSVVDNLNDVIARKAGWGKRSVRLQSLSVQIGNVLFCSEDYINEIKVLAKIADIGLVGIDDQLIRNRAKLSGKDKMDYLKHIEVGRDIISSIDELEEMVNQYLDIYRRYDEWKDEIALSSRIIACAIGFDDITLQNNALRFEYIQELLNKEKGVRYCPRTVDALISVIGLHYA